MIIKKNLLFKLTKVLKKKKDKIIYIEEFNK